MKKMKHHSKKVLKDILIFNWFLHFFQNPVVSKLLHLKMPN